jgi:dTDP-4-dehydrorhamnose reductase
VSAPARDVLLTGGTGQVGQALRRLAPPHWRLFAPSRAELDIADAPAIARVAALRPWAAMVNAAAYTAVDRAESDVEAAWRANAVAPALLAKAADHIGAPLVQLSTDYVFDGAKAAPYVETDPVGPLGVYGASKEGGEQAVRTGTARHVILRTAGVVGPDGANFVKTMLRLSREGRPLRVVNDQRGSPTAANDLADAIVRVTERLMEDPSAPTGTYHFAGAGEATWFEVATAIFEAVRRHGGTAVAVTAISTADYPTAARRPANSRLASANITADYGLAPRHWREMVDETVAVLVQQREGAPR